MKQNISNLWAACSKFVFGISLTILATLFFSPANAQDAKANFAGTWTINTAKSNLGEGNFRSAKQLTVTQEGTVLAVSRVRTGRNGAESTSTDKFTLDGKENVSTSDRGSSNSVATWSADGKELTIVSIRSFDRNGTKTEMKSSEIWSLTDASTLSLVSSSNTPNGERKISLVYDKK